MEYWDVLTSDGKKTGRRVKREHYNRFQPGEYHLVVHIWILNSKGQFLIQKRSEKRQPMPGEWAATSGSALAGEVSSAAAARELKEELGISLKTNQLHFLKRFVRKNSLIDLWWACVDTQAETLTLQQEEVTQAKWVSPEQLRQMIDQNEFHHYGTDYFKAIFSLVKP